MDRPFAYRALTPDCFWPRVRFVCWGFGFLLGLWLLPVVSSGQTLVRVPDAGVADTLLRVPAAALGQITQNEEIDRLPALKRAYTDSSARVWYFDIENPSPFYQHFYLLFDTPRPLPTVLSIDPNIGLLPVLRDTLSRWLVDVHRYTWGYGSYRLTVGPLAVVRVFYFASAQGPLPSPVLVEQSLVEHRRALRNLLQGIFQGMVLILALYHFFLFFPSRQLVYLFFALYLLLVSLVFLHPNGLAIVQTESLWPGLTLRVVAVVDSLLVLPYFLFSYHFLKNEDRFVKSLRVAWPYIPAKLLLAALFAYLNDGTRPWVFTLLNSITLVELLANIALVLYLARKGNALFRYFMVSNVALYLGSMVGLVLLLAGVTPYQADYFIQAGILLQAMALGGGLGYRMRIMEQEKRLAQQELILQLEENQEIQQRANLELEEKVRLRTSEIEYQKNIIEHKSKNITDSIAYARLIQQAVLPPADQFDAYFGAQKHCLYFRPRDLVSGDFYFLDSSSDSMVVAVADCTGHGVPGAMMSVLGLSALKETVLASNTRMPNLLLDRLRLHVKAALHQTGKKGEPKDGIDIALCVVQRQGQAIYFAGARNPLYRLRQDHGQWICHEWKPDRMPIGVFPNERPFALQQDTWLPGDRYFMFSDGMLDQFNRQQDRRLMRANFRQWLIEAQQLPLHQQAQWLHERLEAWRGDAPQTDDILILGFEL